MDLVTTSNIHDDSNIIMGELVEIKQEKDVENVDWIFNTMLVIAYAISLISIRSIISLVNTVLLSILLVINIVASKDKCIAAEYSCNTNIDKEF